MENSTFLSENKILKKSVLALKMEEFFMGIINNVIFSMFLNEKDMYEVNKIKMKTSTIIFICNIFIIPVLMNLCYLYVSIAFFFVFLFLCLTENLYLVL